MPWTYSGNPGANPKDTVRFLVGDTNNCDQLLQDGEISWVLSQYNNSPMNAAIRCCEAVISKFSRMADESVGAVSVTFSQKVTAYRLTMADLRNRLSMEDMTPYAGGVSVADVQTVNANLNRVRPDFTKHMMQNTQSSPWIMGLWSVAPGNGPGDGD